MVAPINDRANAVFRMDYRLTGPTWFHTVQEEETPTLFSGLLPISALMLPAFVGNGRYEIARRDEFGIFNLRAGIETERWSIAAFAENLFDKRFVAEVIPAIEFGGSFISPGARRLIGVEAGVRF
jgi:iron complex outermembrane receptor protein